MNSIIFKKLYYTLIISNLENLSMIIKLARLAGNVRMLSDTFFFIFILSTGTQETEHSGGFHECTKITTKLMQHQTFKRI